MGGRSVGGSMGGRSVGGSMGGRSVGGSMGGRSGGNGGSRSHRLLLRMLMPVDLQL